MKIYDDGRQISIEPPFLLVRAGLDLESGLKNGLGARNLLLSLVERLGLVSSSLHHESGPINK